MTIISKKELAQYINRCLGEYIKSLKKMNKPEMNVRDFDTFLGGFMTGYSLGSQQVDPEFIKDTADLVIRKSVAKKLHITGTSEECCEVKIM